MLLKQWKTWLLSWLGLSSLSEVCSFTAILPYMREGKKRTGEETQKGHCPCYSVTSWLRCFQYFTRNTRNMVGASLPNLTRHFISSQNWFALATFHQKLFRIISNSILEQFGDSFIAYQKTFLDCNILLTSLFDFVILILSLLLSAKLEYFFLPTFHPTHKNKLDHRLNHAWLNLLRFLKNWFL